MPQKVAIRVNSSASQSNASQSNAAIRIVDGYSATPNVVLRNIVLTVSGILYGQAASIVVYFYPSFYSGVVVPGVTGGPNRNEIYWYGSKEAHGYGSKDVNVTQSGKFTRTRSILSLAVGREDYAIERLRVSLDEFTKQYEQSFFNHFVPPQEFRVGMVLTDVVAETLAGEVHTEVAVDRVQVHERGDLRPTSPRQELNSAALCQAPTRYPVIPLETPVEETVAESGARYDAHPDACPIGNSNSDSSVDDEPPHPSFDGEPIRQSAIYSNGAGARIAEEERRTFVPMWIARPRAMMTWRERMARAFPQQAYEASDSDTSSEGGGPTLELIDRSQEVAGSVTYTSYVSRPNVEEESSSSDEAIMNEGADVEGAFQRIPLDLQQHEGYGMADLNPFDRVYESRMDDLAEIEGRNVVHVRLWMDDAVVFDVDYVVGFKLGGEANGTAAPQNID
jgi:hypothetical protein